MALTEDRATALALGRGWFGPAAALPFYRNMYLRAGFSPDEIDTAADRFVASLLIFGNEEAIHAHLRDLLGTEIAELSVNILTVTNPIREITRVASLIGAL